MEKAEKVGFLVVDARNTQNTPLLPLLSFCASPQSRTTKNHTLRQNLTLLEGGITGIPLLPGDKPDPDTKPGRLKVVILSKSDKTVLFAQK